MKLKPLVFIVAGLVGQSAALTYRNEKHVGHISHHHHHRKHDAKYNNNMHTSQASGRGMGKHASYRDLLQVNLNSWSNAGNQHRLANQSHLRNFIQNDEEPVGDPQEQESRPEVEFANSYDHEGVTKARVSSEDIPSLGLKVLRKGNGKWCQSSEWARVKYKSWDDKEIEGDDPKPDELFAHGVKTFLIGNFQVSKCWDIAIQLMQAGQNSRFTCPNAIDNGGNEVYIQDSSAKIKVGTDVTYEFEVMSCSSEYPEAPEPEQKPVESERCIYIVAAGVAPQVAMTVGKLDKYIDSKKYKAMGVYDVFVDKWDGENSQNIYQQWIWNIKDQKIRTLAHETNQERVIMLEGRNKNLAAYKESPGFNSNQQFSYDPKTRHWIANSTQNLVGFDWDHWLANDSVHTLGRNELKDGQRGVQWNIYYCKGWKSAHTSTVDKSSKKTKTAQVEEEQLDDDEMDLVNR